MYKLYFISILFALALTCNNYCNGHGKCGAGDKCACFMGWGGADCSLRSCPYDDAFVDVPLGDINHNGKVDSADDALDEWRPKGGIKEDLSGYVTSTRAHRYAECSNAGKCNRENGECECFNGYEGSACQRRGCPTAVEAKVCSGHGSCLTSTTIIHDSTTTGNTAYYGWESEKFMSCKCDEGWEGIDCNMRTCPKGFDPVFYAGVTFYYRITGKNALATVAGSDFYLKFEYDGMIYETPIISQIDTTKDYPKCDAAGKLKGDTNTATMSQITENIRRSIVSNVPYLNQATVSFVCGTEGGASAVVSNGESADLLISNPHGDVKVFLDSKATAIQLSSTSTTALATTKVFSAKGDEITLSNGEISNADQKKAYALCSRRGTCKSETGECNCFTGFSGEACQTQRSIAI